MSVRRLLYSAATTNTKGEYNVSDFNPGIATRMAMDEGETKVTDPGPRKCYYVNAGFAERLGDGSITYRAVIIVEGVRGYYETQTRHHDLAALQAVNADWNARLGLTQADVDEILASSMRAAAE